MNQEPYLAIIEKFFYFQTELQFIVILTVHQSIRNGKWSVKHHKVKESQGNVKD